MFLVPPSSRAVDPYLQPLLLRVSLSRLGGKHRHIWRCRLEGFAQDRALPHRVVALGVDQASHVVENLVELVLRLVALLTTRGAIHSADCIVRLTLAHMIPLVARPSTVIVALPIVVIVAAGEATAFLLLFICPALHHIT